MISIAPIVPRKWCRVRSEVSCMALGSRACSADHHLDARPIIEEDKARRLAKIYEAYLDKEISWDDLRLFAETLDRFLPGDYEMLREKETFQTLRGRDAEVLLRLTGLGLLIEDIHRQQWDVVDATLIFDDPDEIEKEERVYRRTEFGNRMVSILG